MKLLSQSSPSSPTDCYLCQWECNSCEYVTRCWAECVHCSIWINTDIWHHARCETRRIDHKLRMATSWQCADCCSPRCICNWEVVERHDHSVASFCPYCVFCYCAVGFAIYEIMDPEYLYQLWPMFLVAMADEPTAICLTVVFALITTIGDQVNPLGPLTGRDPWIRYMPGVTTSSISSVGLSVPLNMIELLFIYGSQYTHTIMAMLTGWRLHYCQWLLSLVPMQPLFRRHSLNFGVSLLNTIL